MAGFLLGFTGYHWVSFFSLPSVHICVLNRNRILILMKRFFQGNSFQKFLFHDVMVVKLRVLEHRVAVWRRFGRSYYRTRQTSYRVVTELLPSCYRVVAVRPLVDSFDCYGRNKSIGWPVCVCVLSSVLAVRFVAVCFLFRFVCVCVCVCVLRLILGAPSVAHFEPAERRESRAPTVRPAPAGRLVAATCLDSK